MRQPIRYAGAPLIVAALLLDAPDARSAAAQAWPPFVLVAGLLLIGYVAGRDGLFDAAASRLVRLPVRPVALLLACLALVALVTALLNLDTAVVFLTPVLVGVARRRDLEVLPLLYGSVFMANASSLFLPGSNLTNLLVLSGDPVSGAAFFLRMLPTALAAAAITAAALVAVHRRALLVPGGPPPRAAAAVRVGLGLWGTLLAAVLILGLANAALPILALGLLLVGVRARGGELAWRETLAWLDWQVLASLFGLAVALGALARSAGLAAQLLHAGGGLHTTAVAAAASVLVNNLPAAVLLSSTPPGHAPALLLGLDVGPNLAVTGSLAVLLWWRAAAVVGERPSALAYTRQGLLLAPLAILGALALSAT